MIMRSQFASAQATLAQALAEYPTSIDLRRAQAGILQQNGDVGAAVAILRTLLAEDPGDTGSAFTLARLLKKQGRTEAVARTLRACLAVESNTRSPDVTISAIELLDESNRKRDAAAIAEAAIIACPGDPRLHAYAGMLAIQLGEFERARERYLFALEHDPRALEWHAPIGLSSTLCYRDPSHPDFALFNEALKGDDLTDDARAELHFALGKAHDDVGAYSDAAHHFTLGNSIRKRTVNWSPKNWHRAVEALLATKPFATQRMPMADFTPVFLVGMPRTGTTLLAELLSRYPQACNRGELPTLGVAAQELGLNGVPDRTAIDHTAEAYLRESRQDDAPYARWFIDKQPLNFRYVELALAMFPDAKIVYCRRNPRDTALSLWMQCFHEAIHGYSHDFGDIALVMRDCERLMDRWQTRSGSSMRTVEYETLVREPGQTVQAIADWIGLPLLQTPSAADPSPASTISTASLWQARQPIHTRSMGRWRAYVTFLPALLQFRER